MNQMYVRIQRLIESDGSEMGWVVDLGGAEPEAARIAAGDAVIYDTSSRFYRHESDARRFAQDLSDLLIVAPIIQAEDDAI